MRRKILTMGLVAALGSVCTAIAVKAETRLALVIGNSAYQAVSELANPARDVRAMAEFLGSAGFEVTAVQDVGQSNMRQAVGEFAAKVASRGSDTVALMFYAGHGLQVDGENFLVPVDARIARESDVPLQSVRLADVMNTLAAAPAKTRIVMLDACRNNPFSEINKVTGRGLAIVDAPGGSILSYATAPGTEAEDGTGVNSPYTSALVVAAKEPGLPIEQAFKRVRWAVHQSTSGRQTPWESSSLTDDFSFFPTTASAGGTSVTPGQPAPNKMVSAKPGSAGQTRTGRSVESWQRELRPMQQAVAYELVIREDSPEAYQAYLQVFKTAPLLERVRTILDRRTLMIAWYGALAMNTPDAYQAFMARYSGSDLAATADRLATRVSLRAFPTALACIAPTPVVPAEPKARTKKEQRPEPKKKVTRVTRSAAPTEPPPKASSGPDAATVMGIIGVGVGVGMGLSRSGPRHAPSGPTPSHSHSEPCCR